MSKTITISSLKLQPPLANPIKATLLYRTAFSSTWTTIASNIDVNVSGDLSAPQSFTVSENVRYILRADNEQCETFYQEEIYLPCDVGCAPGFILSPDGTYCYKINEIAPTPPVGSPDTLVAKSAIQYSSCGAYIYNSGYNINGTGVSTQISLGNAFWDNATNGECNDGNTSDGRMNGCAVWASSTTSNQDVGFSVCINIPVSKTYHVGIGCDNYGSIRLDGVDVVVQNEFALDTQYGIGGACFKIWHIYPIFLPAGVHFLGLFGHNVASLAAVGIEVYDNTPSELQAATSYADLNLIFSTKDEVGKDVLLGTDGYSCPAGYSLDACGSPIMCKQIITQDTIC